MVQICCSVEAPILLHQVNWVSSAFILRGHGAGCQWCAPAQLHNSHTSSVSGQLPLPIRTRLHAEALLSSSTGEWGMQHWLAGTCSVHLIALQHEVQIFICAAIWSTCAQLQSCMGCASTCVGIGSGAASAHCNFAHRCQRITGAGGFRRGVRGRRGRAALQKGRQGHGAA